MSWSEVKKQTHDNGKSKHHFISYDKICKEARARFEALKLTEYSYSLFSFALNNKLRIFGIRTDEYFHVNVSQKVISMDLNTSSNLPEWLDEETIEMLRKDLEGYDNLYTREDEMNIPFDGTYDVKRSRAYHANRILSKYGLI